MSTPTNEDEAKAPAAKQDEEAPAPAPMEEQQQQQGGTTHRPPVENTEESKWNGMPPPGTQGYPQPSWVNPAYGYWNPGLPQTQHQQQQGDANNNNGQPPPGAWGPHPPPEYAAVAMVPYPTINPNEYRDFLAWQQSRSEHEQHPPSGAGGPEAGSEQHHHRHPHWMAHHPAGYPQPPPQYPPYQYPAGAAEMMEAAGKQQQSPSKKKQARSTTAGGKKTKKPHEQPTQAAMAAALLYPAEETVEPLDTEWADLCTDAAFVCPALRGDISDALYVAISQFKPTALTQDDKIGKYKNRELGFTGLCCKYCGGTPGYGRYFPSSYDSFLNGTNCAGILQHIKSDCLACPERVRDTVQQLSLIRDPGPSETTTTPQGRPRYGSRKRFFSYVWAKLRSTTVTPGDADIGGQVQQGGGNDANDNTNNDGSGTSHDQLEEIVRDSKIVSIQDRHLVSDATLVAMAQMQICSVTEEDKVGRCKDHKIGFKGLCCRHCGGKAGKPGFGRYFATSMRSLAQADSCKQIEKHVMNKCTQCPPDIRRTMLDLNALENGKDQHQQRIKYGSRKIFFKRLWGRLHGDDEVAAAAAKEDDKEDGSGDPNAEGSKKDDKGQEEVPWEHIIGKSPVVTLEDRGLISDSQLAAIAQMDLCQLTQADRIGWFKNRAIGFGGLCCKHCKGKPSFGRYFPNSVRSFAQTTSSQTIISHVCLYCPDCPQDIRDWILKLQHQETESSQNNSYGSRKIFFNRVWAKMHDGDEAAGTGETTTAAKTTTTASDEADTQLSIQEEVTVAVEAAAAEANKKRDAEEKAIEGESSPKRSKTATV